MLPRPVTLYALYSCMFFFQWKRRDTVIEWLLRFCQPTQFRVTRRTSLLCKCSRMLRFVARTAICKCGCRKIDKFLVAFLVSSDVTFVAPYIDMLSIQWVSRQPMIEGRCYSPSLLHVAKGTSLLIEFGAMEALMTSVAIGIIFNFEDERFFWIFLL